MRVDRFVVGAASVRAMAPECRAGRVALFGHASREHSISGEAPGCAGCGRRSYRPPGRFEYPPAKGGAGHPRWKTGAKALKQGCVMYAKMSLMSVVLLTLNSKVGL